jgi:hypothetical protein
MQYVERRVECSKHQGDGQMQILRALHVQMSVDISLIIALAVGLFDRILAVSPDLE